MKHPADDYFNRKPCKHTTGQITYLLSVYLSPRFKPQNECEKGYVSQFLKDELIYKKECDDEYFKGKGFYRISGKGIAFVEMILNTPYPVKRQVWTHSL